MKAPRIKSISNRRATHKMVGDVEFKFCCDCGTWISLADYYKDVSRWDEVSSRCKDCCHKRRQRFMRNNPRKSKEYSLRYSNGMTLDEFDLMFESQNGCCAICGKEPTTRTLHVDHNHVTGTIRELLCHECNTSLGLVNESAAILSRMIDYLEKHNG